MEPEDLEFLYQIENNQALWGVSASNVPYSHYLLNDFILNSTGDIYTDKQVRMVVEDEQHHAIGLADLTEFSPKHRRAELGLVISQEYRHKGYGVAALSAIIDYARQSLQLHQIYAFVPVANSASLAMFRQLAIEPTAILPDWLCDGQRYHDAAFIQVVLDKA